MWLPLVAVFGVSAPGVSQDLSRVPPRFELQAPLPGVPGVWIDRRQDGIGLANQIARSRGLQARILWIDCTANIERYNEEAKIVTLVERIRTSGFNTIVFDIKPISGQVIYPSRFAPKLEEWRGRRLTREFDPVPIMIREARRHGLWIYASLNAFSEGHRMFGVGPGYARRDQQTVLYEFNAYLSAGNNRWPLGRTLNQPNPTGAASFTALTASVRQLPGHWLIANRGANLVHSAPSPLPMDIAVPRGGAAFLVQGPETEHAKLLSVGSTYRIETEPVFVPISERPEQQIPLMMNPHHPEVIQYALDVVGEVAEKYAFDGIIYDDRLRFGGLNADFSPQARAAFEATVQRQVRWPEDIFRFTLTPGLVRGVEPGPLYSAWMAFRAQTLQNFLERARRTIDSARPGMRFGVYVGSWFGEYPSFGSNWGSPELDAGFWFLTPEYARQGFASQLDFVITGCYYPRATIHEAMANGEPIGRTVEAAGHLSVQAVRDATWTYAGIMLSDFKDNPRGLSNALQAAVRSTQGVMVFDLSHDIDPFWDVFGRAFAQPSKPPHVVPNLLLSLRAQRVALDRKGVRFPTVILSEGSAGTGH